MKDIPLEGFQLLGAAIGMIAGFLFLLNVAAFPFGMISGAVKDRCNYEFTRPIDFIAPGHVVGCWLVVPMAEK